MARVESGTPLVGVGSHQGVAIAGVVDLPLTDEFCQGGVDRGVVRWQHQREMLL